MEWATTGYSWYFTTEADALLVLRLAEQDGFITHHEIRFIVPCPEFATTDPLDAMRIHNEIREQMGRIHPAPKEAV